MWTHEDGPEAHPMWERQVELERGMMRAGADRFRDRVIDAESRGQMTRLAPVRGLLEDWLPQIAATLKGWLRDVKANRGPTPLAYQYLVGMDPFVASLIALREVLDGIAKERQSLTSLSVSIGRTIEHEQRVRLWESKEPDLYYHYEKEQTKARSTAVHRRRVNISRFNFLLGQSDNSLEWLPWNEEAMFRVGMAMIDVIVRKTGWFEVLEDPDHVWGNPGKGRHRNKPKLVLQVKEGLTAWVGKAFDHAEVTSPVFKPTVVPPRRWEGSRKGGYWTPYVNGPRLVRFKASQEEQKDRAADEYDALDMPKVYDAIHLLQETAWRVNRRVLDVATIAWARDLEIAGLPRLTEEALPARPVRLVEHTEAARLARERGATAPEMDEQTEKELLRWKRDAVPVYRRNARRVSRSRSTSATVLVAQEFQDFEAIYFPHMLDFRGRMYPIPTGLQPQGDDLARGLLTFADGMPLTEANGGADWLAIHLASSWGNDKVSFQDRIQWVHEREDLWRSIAADPLANLAWAATTGPEKVDKPWQTLAAIFEWVDYLEHGEGFLSSLPVMVDGTCNGIQHLAAITRDETAGEYVNLVPGEKPRDIYKFVAQGLQAKLERISKAGGPEGAKADWWLALGGHDLPRSLTKRQVMVLPYGGTKDSFFNYTRKWLDEHDPVDETTTDEHREKRKGYLSFLVTHLWDTVKESVSGGMEVMEWLQRCAKAAAEANQPIFWITPAGFVVRHFYGLVKMRQVETLLDGQRVQLAVPERTRELSVRDQLRGISPNFIHSLDAAALTECLAMCREAGITDFSSVHDAYGTHAANAWPLFDFLRRAFVKTHEADVLGEFRLACHRVLVALLVETKGMDVLDAAERAEALLPKPLEHGALELQRVLESDYFFA